MVITPTDRKISQMPVVAPAFSFLVPVIDPAQPGLNFAADLASILALPPPPDWSEITNTPTTLAGYGITDAQPLNTGLTQISALGDPNIDRILFWDDSAGAYTYLEIGSGISITGTVLNAVGLGGTVTTFSAGDLAPLFTTAVATPATTPALTFSLNTQLASTVFAGPAAGGPVAPTFRSLVLSDIPNLASLYQPLDSDLTAIASLGTTAYGRGFLVLADATAARTYIGAGTVTSFSSGGLSPLFTTNVATSTTTPALSFTLNTQAANMVFAGPAAAGPLAPSFRALVAADIPNLSGLYQPLDGDLTAISALTGTNTIYYRSAADTWSPVVIGAGLTFTGGTLIATGGSGGAVDAIIGTADQVLVNAAVGIPQTGIITLTLPQSIATTSNVQFGSLVSQGAISVQSSTADVIFGNNGTQAFFPALAGRGLFVQRNGIAAVNLFSAAQSTTFFGVQTEGTLAAPTATGALRGTTISAGSFDGTNYFVSAAMELATLEAATAAARGSSIFWRTILTGTTPLQERMRVSGAGNLLVGTSTETGIGGPGKIKALGIEDTPIGATTPSTGSFTNLFATSASFTAINNTPIGPSTPSTGVFTTIDSIVPAGPAVRTLRLIANGTTTLGDGPALDFLHAGTERSARIYSRALNTNVGELRIAVGAGASYADSATFTNTGINATPIGATTPSTGNFTNLTSTGDYTTTGDVIITKNVPALRLRGTEASGRNAAFYESAGVVRLGEESVADRFSFDLATGGFSATGDVVTNSVFRVLPASPSGLHAAFGTDGAGALVGTLSNHYQSIYTNGAERVRIDTAGNVGIGTATPTAKLTVTDGSDARIKIFTNGSVGRIDAVANTDEAVGRWLTINQTGGFVAIGTTVPTAAFHVKGSIRFESFGAGTLVTDASGNVGVSASGGTGPGIAKSWGIVDGAGVIVQSYGVASVSRLGAGIYQVDFPTAHATDRYPVMVTCCYGDNIGWVDAQTTTSFQVKLKDTLGPLEDCPFSFVVFDL